MKQEEVLRFTMIRQDVAFVETPYILPHWIM